MLFARRESASELSLVKLYVLLDVERWQHRLSRIVATVIDRAESPSFHYSLNYKEAKRYKDPTFSSALDAVHLDSLEYLDVLSADGRCGVFVTLPFPPKSNRRLYEICVYGPVSADFTANFVEIAKLVTAEFKTIYGYGRLLPTDANPLTETRRKRTLFGNTVLKGDATLHDWKTSPQHTDSGAMKGLYVFNVVNPALLRDDPFATLLQRLPPSSVVPLAENLSAVFLGERDLEYVRDNLTGEGSFVRD